MTAPSITVAGLGKRYRLGQTREPYRHVRDVLAGRVAEEEVRRTLWALRDVSFTVQPGEAVGIIGANGAGKTTLLKILSRITEPSEGEARVRGRVGSLLEVGTGFHLELTGRENVYLNGAILGMRKAEIDRKLDDIVEFSEIGRFLDTPVKRYSTGMYVRLAFAVAAHLDADILLVDEVLSVGDLAFQRKCLAKMETQTGAEGRTVLFVSHNLASVKLLTERCIWLENGGVRMIGPTDEVFREYVLSHAGGEAGGSLDFSDLTASRPPDKALPQEVTFERVSLIDGAGRVSDVHLSGEPITVEIAFRCRTPVFDRPLRMMARLRTLEGVIVFTTKTPLLEETLRDGLYRTQFTIAPNPLAAGIYQLALTIDSGTAQDFLPVAMRFRVEANPRPGDDADYLGLVHVDYAWSDLEPVEVGHALAPR